MNLVMEPELVQHFKDQIAMPKRSLLFNYRLYVDYCCMLWAREFVFSASLPDWHTHFRLDSSPQFGRNYLVGELDRICLNRVSAADLDEVFRNIDISTRLCPLQILGKQATSTAYKAKSSLRILSLECNVDVARRAVRSLLTDMGVESGLWTVPDISGGGGRCYPESMPLADGDHMLHHTMMDGEGGFSLDNPLWQRFDQQIQAISKCFSKQDHCERYAQKNIWENDRIPKHAKRGLASMFSRKCPTFIKTRWHFAFDVLHWISHRKQLIDYLEPTAVQTVVGSGQSDITAAEAKAFQDLGNSEDRCRFWACFWSYYTLQDWGFGVQTWMHECPCHSPSDTTVCPLRGRRMIELTSGQCGLFLDQLKNLTLDANREARAALNALNQFDPQSVGVLQRAFHMAKRSMAMRYEQSTAFYGKFPWNMPRLLGFILPHVEDKTRAILESKSFARELLASFAKGELPSDTFAKKFFQGALVDALNKWASNVKADTIAIPMQNDLFKELLSYSLALCVMQRLEARHHLVSQKMNPARANSAATVSATLRRRLNPDCCQASFQSKFGEYLQRFDELVAEKWSSMRELHNLISGHHLELMFQDTSFEEQLIEANSEVRRISQSTRVEYQNHLAAALTEGSYYAVPVSVSTSGQTSFHLLQLVALRPANKKYMERVVSWSTDNWYEQVGICSFGITTIRQTTIDVDAADCSSSQVCQLPTDFCGTFVSSSIEAFPVDAFFTFGFENVQKFSKVDFGCEFSIDAVESAVADSGLGEEEGSEVDAHVSSFESLASNPTLMSLSRYIFFVVHDCVKFEV